MNTRTRAGWLAVSKKSKHICSSVASGTRLHFPCPSLRALRRSCMVLQLFFWGQRVASLLGSWRGEATATVQSVSGCVAEELLVGRTNVRLLIFAAGLLAGYLLCLCCRGRGGVEGRGLDATSLRNGRVARKALGEEIECRRDEAPLA